MGFADWPHQEQGWEGYYTIWSFAHLRPILALKNPTFIRLSASGDPIPNICTTCKLKLMVAIALSSLLEEVIFVGNLEMLRGSQEIGCLDARAAAIGAVLILLFES